MHAGKIRKAILTRWAQSGLAAAVVLTAGAAPFEEVPPPFPPLYSGSLAWGDYDNDGDLDLAVLGTRYPIQPTTRLYRNEGGGVFSPIGTAFEQLSNGSLAWSDYDNDGDLDLAACGIYSGLDSRSHIYRGHGNGQFTDIGAPLIGCKNGALAWGDFDNDGDLDLLMNGENSGARLYRNDRGSFSPVATSLFGLEFGFATAVDFDNDGRLDPVLSGFGGGYTAQAYRNLGGFNFTPIPPFIGGGGNGAAWSDFDNDGDFDLLLTGGPFPQSATRLYRKEINPTNFTAIVLGVGGLHSGLAAWGDYDNDGRPDFVVAGGATNNTLISRVYHNDGAGAFSDSGLTIPGVSSGSAAWADYDNDGRLDLAWFGHPLDTNVYGGMFHNINDGSNSPPGAPSFPQVTVSSSGATFSWAAAVDANQTGSLTYNLRVGTAPGRADVLAPMSDLATGFRRVAQHGNTGLRQSWTLTNLAAGNYYWSVQAVDHAFAGGPFTPEQSFFAVTPVSISDIPDQAISISSTTALLPFSVGDPEFGAAALGLRGDSSNPNLVPVGNIVFGGSGSNRTVRVTPVAGLSGTTTITVTATNANGRYASDSFLLIVQNMLPTISAIADQITTAGAPTALLAFTVGDAETPAANLLVTARSSNTNFVPEHLITFGGSGSNRTVRATPLDGRSGSTLIIVTVTDAEGGMASEAFQLSSGVGLTRFTEVPSGMMGLYPVMAAAGDYDTDGDLDVLMAGTITNDIHTTRLYRNNGGGAFADSGVALPAVTIGALGWADADGDADLDFVLTGYVGPGTTMYAAYYANLGNGSFVPYPGPPAVQQASLDWADFDGDGDLDLMLAGTGLPSTYTRVYLNAGRFGFYDAMAGTSYTYDGALAVGDFDGDGFPDALVTGLATSIPPVTYLYRNTGSGTGGVGQHTFTYTPHPFPGVFRSAVAWGDYDNDGDLDVAMAGLQTPPEQFTRVYRNNGAGAFSDINAPLIAVHGASVAWGDYDNDGDLDLVVAGYVQSGGGITTPTTRLYRNDNGVFVQSGLTLPGVAGHADWGDYDNDGDLDLLLMGNTVPGPRPLAKTILLRNDFSLSNVLPAPPQNLTAAVTGNSVTLSWTSGSDFNQPAGLTYNVRVGTAPGEDDVVSAMARADGRRLLAKWGNATPRLTRTIRNLPFGHLYWSVQTVDHGFAGSAFAPEQSFHINLPPVLTDLADVTVPVNISPILRSFNISDDATPASNLVVTASLLFPDYIITPEHLELSGEGNERTLRITPPPNLVGTATIVVTVRDDEGGVTTDSFVLRIRNEGPFLPLFTNQTVSVTAAPLAIPFEVYDPEFGTNVTLTVVSLNTNLVAPEGLTISGSGSNRVLHVMWRPSQTGTASILMEATDPLGAFVSRAFVLTVVNYPPTISPIADVNVYPGVPLPLIPFTAHDPETPPEQLLIGIAVLNPAFLPTNAVAIEGTGTNRVLRITPPPDAIGSTTIQLTVRESTNGQSATASFVLRIEAFTSVGITLPRYTNGLLALIDFDRDDDLDAFTAGNSSGTRRTLLMRNAGNYIFTSASSTLFSVDQLAAAWGDIDHDGDVDLVYSGSSGASGPALRLYRNDGGGAMTQLSNSFLATARGSLDWGDFDNDGDLDLLLTGAMATTNTTRIYRNNGAAGFSAMFSSLPPAVGAGSSWGDYDRDGDLDILLVNSNSTRIFRNNGNDTFTDSSVALPGISDGMAAWGDFDNDGDLDVALAGTGIGLSNNLSRIYRNDTTSFTDLDAGLPGLARSTVLWADLDNDGRLDLLLTGHELNNTIRTLLCVNQGDGTFGVRSNLLPAVSRGAVAAGDLDADGDLDLVLSGAPLTSSPILRNNSPATNLPPSAPAGLVATVMSNSVLLGWSPANDDHQTSGLTYNVRVGTTPDDGDILPAMANPMNGFRHVVKPGNAGTRFDKRLNRLPPGVYYWNVQAIDQAFLASQFGDESTFVVTNEPPVISPIDEYIGPRNRTTGPVLFTIGDFETPAANLFVRGASSDTSLVRDADIVFSGAGSNRLAYITPVGTATGQVSITLTVEDAHGASAQSTFSLIVLQAAPDLSDIPNQLTAFNTRTPPIPFLVSDLDHDAVDLIVTADVSNTNLVPLANIQFGGSGSNRTITFTPALNQHGTTTVFLTVTDPLGEVTSKAFALVITNHAPVISAIADQSVLPGAGPLVVPFTIGDAETPAGALELSFSSSNADLLPLANIILGGSESNRTITLTAVSNALGAATVTVTVRDAGGTTASDVFVFRIEQFTPLASMLTNLWQSQPAWGDYDNDGDLDLLMSGWTRGSIFDTFLYRNDGSNAWTRVTNGVPTGNRGGVAWGDFNNDGWLDFLYLSGNSTALYRNTGTNSFVAFAIGVPTMFQAAIAPSDFDNDGWLDFAVAGDIGQAAPNGTTRIYRNTGGATFADIGAALPSVTDASLAWADYDRDGDLDLLLAGGPSRQITAVSRVFRNDGGVFNDVNAGLFGAGRGSAAWGDYNHDGYPDILLCGLNGNSNVTRLYRNSSGSGFVEVAASLPPTQGGSGAWGDFDNDGLLDVLLTGLSQGGPLTRVFRGDGNGGFTDIIAALPGVYLSAGKWADFDGDGDLDVLLTGTTNGGTSGAITRLFQNNSLHPNLPPTPPANVIAILDSAVNRAVFSWNGASDTETPAVGLTYALRLGTNSGGGQIVAAPADPTNGRRRLVQFGEIGSRGQWAIEDLPKGEYFWAIQAVDNAFAGSAFSPEQTFLITNARPVISDITNQIAFPGVRTAPIPFFVTDQETPAGALTLTGFSSDTTLIPPESIQFGGVGGNRTVSFVPSAQLGGLATFTVRVTDQAGAWRSDSFAVTVEAFSTVTNLGPAGGSMVTWGDFDNDNDLDLFVSGSVGSPGFPQFVPGRLYRNNGGTNFAVVPENNFTVVTDGAATFGDADGDGDLDLLLAGTLTSPFVALYRNNHPQPFSQFVPGSFFMAPANPAAAWGDADNDGDIDLLIAGRLFGATSWPTILYRNNGSGVFSNAFISLPGVYSGTALWADFDRDGDQDIFLSGNTNASTNAPIARLYRNEDGTNFTDLAAGFPGVASSSAAWGDFDRDGDLDLALCGLLASSNAITRVFRNEGGTNFTDIVAGLPGVSGGSMAWADYDNDGWTDLFVCGTTNSQESGALTRLYRNNGNGTFSDARAGLPDVTRSSVAWADIDNDGDIDLALSGTGSKGPTNLIARVFRNNTPTPPALLEPPPALVADVSGRRVELNWHPSPQIAPPLADISSYNLRVVRTNHSVLVMPPHANQTNGFHRIARLGNAGPGTRWILKNLLPGDYAWSVQAISHNYAGSPFSIEGRFTITNTPPLVTNHFRTVMEDQLLSLQLYAFDPDAQLLTFAVLIPPTNGTVTGTAPFLSYRPFANYFGPDSMTFTVHDTLVTVPGVVNLNVLPVADVAATRMAIETMQAGGFEIVVRGEPYQSYAIESSDDLIAWILLDEIRASPTGDIRHGVSMIDTHRFFRARSLP